MEPRFLEQITQPVDLSVPLAILLSLPVHLKHLIFWWNITQRLQARREVCDRWLQVARLEHLLHYMSILWKATSLNMLHVVISSSHAHNVPHNSLLTASHFFVIVFFTFAFITINFVSEQTWRFFFRLALHKLIKPITAKIFLPTIQFHHSVLIRVVPAFDHAFVNNESLRNVKVEADRYPLQVIFLLGSIVGRLRRLYHRVLSPQDWILDLGLVKISCRKRIFKIVILVAQVFGIVAFLTPQVVQEEFVFAAESLLWRLLILLHCPLFGCSIFTYLF